MKKIITLYFVILLFSTCLFAQKVPIQQNEPREIPAEYKSDNCTFFPDCDYAHCCVEHDKAYYFGGSWKERWRADKKLYKCVAAKKGFQHKIIAPVMWLGVRVGGVSWLPTKFRWGFGKKKAKKCASLSEEKSDCKDKNSK